MIFSYKEKKKQTNYQVNEKKLIKETNNYKKKMDYL